MPKRKSTPRESADCAGAGCGASFLPGLILAGECQEIGRRRDEYLLHMNCEMAFTESVVCGKNIFADPVTGGRTKPRHWEATAVSRPILLNSEQFAHIHDQPIVPTPGIRPNQFAKRMKMKMVAKNQNVFLTSSWPIIPSRKS